MKYVEWVEAVLRSAVDLKTGAARGQFIGMPQIATQLGLEYDPALEALGDALTDLDRMGLVELKSQHQVEIAQEARKIVVASLATSWPAIHDVWIDEHQAAFLRGVCELSEQRAEDRAWLAEVHAYDVFASLNWERDDDHIADLVFGLGKANLLVTNRVTMGGGWTIYPTYLGVVRATEAEASELEALVRRLLPDWETTNVDFKRELHLDSNDQKAEFIRDVLALANTPVTGERYLVLGWDPNTHDFATGVDVSVTQDRIEDLLDRFSQPTVTVSYRTFAWGTAGTAGVVEVKRDRTKVPYRVRQRLAGARRTVEVGDVYVRHGSHVVTAELHEVAELEAEAAFARTRAVN
jgi:hypothetical protein